MVQNPKLTGDTSPKRDPRSDPKAGDVLVIGDSRIEVTERTARRILYKLTFLRPRSPIDSAPMNCGLYLNRWKEVVENAEVLHAAE